MTAAKDTIFPLSQHLMQWDPCFPLSSHEATIVADACTSSLGQIVVWVLVVVFNERDRVSRWRNR
jgi:hypothetical protein